MKKITMGLTALLLVTSMSVMANGGGKKKAKKAARKAKTECCAKPVCCDKNSSNCVKLDGKAEIAEETKNGDDCCNGQTTCGPKEN